ncbi:aspartate kinase, partial [mine drainage metagenome]
MARALALGESLGASLFASALAAHGVPVRLLLPGEPAWPLLTRGDPMAAEIDLEASAPRVEHLFGPGTPILVLPGFVGIDGGTGRVCTLGRGGSDTTAVALGRLLGRSEVILVKDVPGVLEADPRIVPGARPLAELTVTEMEALARGGATVVAASALAYMSETVVLRVISIGQPLDGTAGTV